MYGIYMMMDLIRSKRVVEEGTVIQDNMTHRQSATTTGSCRELIVPPSLTLKRTCLAHRANVIGILHEYRNKQLLFTKVII
jgi:hypothetical protein